MNDPNVTQMLDTDLNRTQMIGAPNINATQTIQPVQCPVCKSFNPAGCIYCNECGLVFSMSDQLAEDVFGAPAVRLPCLIDESGREHYLRPGINLVGREGDVLLEDSQISRKHAEINLTQGKIILKDLSSTNGTFLEETKLEPNHETEIQQGAKIRFGSSTVTLSVPGQMQATQMPIVAETEPEPSAEFSSATLFTDSQEWKLKFGENSIGRRDTNDVQISDPYASGQHGKIIVSNNEVSFTDVGSTNGTMLNGSKLPPNEAMRITSEDELQIGSTVFKIKVEE